MPTLRCDDAAKLCGDILSRLETPPDIAAQIGRWLVNSDLAGHTSHGVTKVVDYAHRIHQGSLVPRGRPTVTRGEASGAAILVDGGGGFGQLSAHLLTSLLVERLADHPIVIGGIVNASHTGRLGEWAEQAARSGAVLVMFTASVERSGVAAFGAREARLGTNPLAVSVPAADGDSMILDFATSQIAGGRVHHLKNAGKQAPAGSLIDKDGNPTTDPFVMDDGGMLQTFGEHKGYGISLLISVLSGCIVGSAFDDPTQQGVLAIAFDPAVFADRDVVLTSVHAQLERMRTTPPRPGFDQVSVPGDPERAAVQRAGDSLTIPDATWDEIVALAKEVGADLPAI